MVVLHQHPAPLGLVVDGRNTGQLLFDHVSSPLFLLILLYLGEPLDLVRLIYQLRPRDAQRLADWLA